MEPPTTTTTTTVPPTTTTEPPPTTTTTTVPVTTTTVPVTTTTSDPPISTTSTRTRTRTRTTTTTSSSYSPPTTTSSTTTSDPIVPTSTTSTTITPTLSPSPSNAGGVSSGAIVGIVIAVLLALIAALISAFLIKRRRKRRFNQTSDTLFNPVNNNATLAMQENQHYHPTSSSAPRKDYPQAGGTSGGLRGRESVEPLNAHTVATSMLAGGAGNRVSSGGASDNSGTSSAYAAYMHYQSGVSYHPPTEPTYSQYGVGTGWNNESAEYNNDNNNGMMPMTGDFQTESEAAAYAQYEQEQQDLYLHQLMMQQQQQDLHEPVEYYDPRASSDYYPSYPQPPVVMNQSQPLHETDRSALASLTSGSEVSIPPPPPPVASAMASAPTVSAPVSFSPPLFPTTGPTASMAHTTTTTPSSAINSPSSEPLSVQQYYDDTENDAAYNTKSEPWASPKRNPQVLIDPSTSATAAGTAADQIKVPVSESPYATGAMTRPS
ncbi:hypothetical protein BGX24_004192 [Mortierella sp. AD032]|nr:hypothetical protein BGX24_004192 [Mortierella sp. AD032]